MRYFALACDYDGTLAHHGRVSDDSLTALERLLNTGRKLILVTGRELDQLLAIFPGIDFFEWVVAENGAVLYRPASRQEKVLAQPPPQAFVQTLRQRGVAPLSVGRVIVATWQPHEREVLDAIRDLGLELQVIFNKGAVMVLPAGVNKATGLASCLQEMNLSPHEVVGVGDAENDHAFLSLCECSAAVANALPALKERADFVTTGDHGVGVAELIQQLIDTDLREWGDRLTRHHLVLGTRADGTAVLLPPYGPNLLIAGPSGSGKSTVATSFLERLAERRYQFCIIDPEGDYANLEMAVTLGKVQCGPPLDEVLEVLAKPDRNAVVNLVGLPLADRPPFFLGLLLRLQETRARTGRPHWLVVDEAHHLLPTSWEPGTLAFPQDLNRTVFITVHPDQVAPGMLASVGTVIAVGAAPETTLGLFCKVLGIKQPILGPVKLNPGEVLLWPRHSGQGPYKVQITPTRIERHRHTRKYAEGELPPDRSFYFRGPEGKLNLRAQNMQTFIQLANGLDDETWSHHLRLGDYSRWIREAIKDERLAAEVEAIERQNLSPAESRARIRQTIERYYTLPASTSPPTHEADAARASA